MKTTRFAELRRALVDATNKGEANVEPCLVNIASGSLIVGLDYVAETITEHTLEDFDRMLYKIDDRLDRVKAQIDLGRWANDGVRDPKAEPKVITEVMDKQTVSAVNAIEVFVLFSMLPLLAAYDDEQARKVIADRPEYAAALSLASVFLSRHFPTVSLPTEDTETAATAPATSSIVAHEETAEELLVIPVPAVPSE